MIRAFVVVGLLAGLVHADPKDGSRARAVRKTSAISVDGKLDEPTWQTAPHHKGFSQRFPIEGAKALHETEFAVVYDDEAVYVGVWADDPDPSQIRRTLTRRDVDAIGDAVLVAFDSYNDKRTAFVFQLNAAGVQRDFLVFDDTSLDDTWDAVWTGNVAITKRGWSAEFRIPLNQLRFSAKAAHEWGMQVVRLVARTNEQSSWSPWPRTTPQVVSVFGVVEGIEKLRPARRLELLPYVSGGAQQVPVEAGDPLTDHRSMIGNVGVDVKYGLGPAFTLSATINPDFGQVEADPSAVNLSANELFFAERRPFFLEGVDLFKIPLEVGNDGNVEGAFYTRRIGAAPTTEPDGYEYLASPKSTTIYTAAKITGKQAGWSVGLLDAVTGQEVATIVDADGNRARPIVAPLTNYAVGRVKRDLRGGATQVGLSATAVNRQLEGTGLEDLFHDQAYTLGTQINHRWANNAWRADFGAIGSVVHGTEAAITATQTNQRHLFQRPDTYRLDPTRTNLVGAGASWAIGRSGDTKHWRYATGGQMTTPGLELNDAGFQRLSDLTIPWLWAQYHDEKPGDHILNWQANSNVFFITTSEPRVTDYGWEGNVSAQLVNQWSMFFSGGVFKAIWDRGALRGGPALHQDTNAGGNVGVSSDARKRVRVDFNMGGGRRPAQDSGDFHVAVGATIQARPNIDIFLGPTWSRRDDAMQYVAEAADEMGVPHYVFARIDQTTVAMTTRVNWTFSPKLSLQIYAQPFVSTGRYSDFKDVNKPGAPRFLDRFTLLEGNAITLSDGVFTGRTTGTFSFDRPDFSFTQIRSNVVLRWEYRPGSSVFAIWSHGQTSVLDDGRFRLGRDLADLGDSASEDIVMVKVNYWIGL